MKILYKIFFLLSLSLAGVFYSAEAQTNEQQRIYSNGADKKLTAYPTPASNTVYFKLSSGLRAEARTVELVSVIGRTVAVQKINANDNDDIVFSNLSQLPEGVYVGVTKNAEGKVLQTTKLIIQR